MKACINTLLCSSLGMRQTGEIGEKMPWDAPFKGPHGLAVALPSINGAKSKPSFSFFPDPLF